MEPDEPDRGDGESERNEPSSIEEVAADSAAAAALLERLRSSGVDSVEVERRTGTGPLELRVRRGGR